VVVASRFAVRLRSQIHQAADGESRRPVLISGEPGLEKDNLVALINFWVFASPTAHAQCAGCAASARLSPERALQACSGDSLLICGVDRCGVP